MTARNYHNYTSTDSMVYHNSMFLKKLSAEADEQHKTGWRDRLGHFLESRPEQIFIFVLIIVDLLIVCTQLFIVDPAIKCNETPHVMATYDPGSDQHSSGHSEEGKGGYHLAEEILSYASFTILTILALEMVLLLIAFDVKFFKQPLYILDLLVISGTIVAEVFEGLGNNNPDAGTLPAAGNLVIFFRLWRVLRIVHGVAMSVQEQAEEKMKHLEKELAEVKEEKDKLATKFEYIKKRYKKLVDAANDEEDRLPPIPGDAPRKIRIKDDGLHDGDDDDDEYDRMMMSSPPKSEHASPFKSPGAPHMLNHTSIVINGSVLTHSQDDEHARNPLILPTNPGDYNTFRRSTGRY